MNKNNNSKNAVSVMYGIGEALNIIVILVVFVLAVILATNILNGGAWYNSANPQSVFFSNKAEYLSFCQYAFIGSLFALTIQVVLCVLAHKIYKSTDDDAFKFHIAMIVLGVLGFCNIFYVLGAIFFIVTYKQNKNKIL